MKLVESLRKGNFPEIYSKAKTRLIDFFVYYVWGSILSMDKNHCFLFAGGLAFSLAICIIPFIFIIFWILGVFLSSADVEMQVKTFIETIIPYQNYALYVENIIFARISELVEYKTLSGVLGLGGLFFTASNFFSSIRTVLNRIFGNAEDYTLLIGKLFDFALIIGVLIILFLLTMLLPLLEILKKLSESVSYLSFFGHEIFQQLFAILFSLVMIFIVFFVLYRIVPKKKVRTRSIAIGALIAAIGWVTVKEIFGYYISNISSYNVLYGTYAIIIGIAIWIYYTALIFIYGSVIAEMHDIRLDEMHIANLREEHQKQLNSQRRKKKKKQNQ